MPFRKSPDPELPACDDALLGILASPLNDPRLVDAAREQLRGMKLPVSTTAFDASNRLPVLSWLFDADFYLASNPDVAEAGVEPYIHFLQYGLAEQRDPHPLVDLGHVSSQLGRHGGDGALSESRLADVLRSGRVDPHPLFDCAFYLERNPDVTEAALAPLEHFIRHGAEEGRAPNARFQADWYLSTYPGAVPDGTRYAAFVHYARFGAQSGHEPAPPFAAGSEDDPHAPPEPAQDPPVAAGYPVEGVLDAVREHVAYGWTRAPGDPERRLEVDILEGTRVVGRGVADHFRQDLEKGGIGDGRHAFAIPLSRALLDGGRHGLVARVRDNPDGALHGRVEQVFPVAEAEAWEWDPFPVDPADAAALAGVASGEQDDFVCALGDSILRIETGEYQVALDLLDAMENRWPASTVVAIKAGEAQLGLGRPDRALEAFQRAVEAGGPFKDWAWLGLGNAQRLLGQWREAGERFVSEVPPEPAQDPPVAAGYPVEGALDAVREHVAYGWTRAPGDPERRLEVDILEGTRVVGRGVADHFRQDLKKGGIGDGRHAFAIPLSRTLLDGGRHGLVARVRDNPDGALHGRIEQDFPVGEPLAWDPFPLDPADPGARAGVVPADSDQFARALDDAGLRIDAGEYQAALDLLDAMGKRWPASPAVALKTGEAQLGLGRPDRALEAFQRALEADGPHQGWAWLGLGNAQRLLGQWREAGESYARGLDAAPDSSALRSRQSDVRAWDTMVEARRKIGNAEPDAALDLLGPLLIERPGSRQVQEAIHEAFELRRRGEGPATGDLDASMEEARRALDLLQLVLDHAPLPSGQAS